MHLLVKLDFAADLTLFQEYTIIIKINIIKNQSRVSYPFSEFVECRYGKGDTPLSCTFSLRWLCGHIVRWL